MELKFIYANCTGKKKNCLYPNTAIVNDINELPKYMKYDYTFIEFKNNYRDKDNFIRSVYATFDVDNTNTDDPNEWIQIADIPKIFEDVWCLVVTSTNHMKIKEGRSPRPKFHIVFRINEITTAKDYKDFMKKVQKKYTFFDPQALDAARFMFGCPKFDTFVFDGKKNLTEFIDLEEKNDKKFNDLDIDFLTPIEEGHRNSTMSKLAGKILKRFGDTQEAYECYLKQAERCLPPLDDSELDTIWTSAQGFYKRISKQIGYIAPEDFGQIEWDEPISFDDVKTLNFPVVALPDKIRKYVEELSESTQTPLDMAASSALSILGVCCQGKYKIRGKSDWIEPLNLYTLIVAEPSERKSAVISSMVRPLNDYEEFYNIANAAKFEENKIAKKILDGKVRAIEDKAIKGKATQEEISEIAKKKAEFKEVKPLKLYVDDITTEKLVKVLKENGSKAAIISSEGGLFDIMSGMYSKTVNIDVFLKAYSGDTLRVDRMGRDSESINNPTLSILLTIQPSVMKNVMQNSVFRGRGLTARFLYSYPTSTIGNRAYRSKSINDESYDSYKQTIFNLLQDEPDKPQIIKLSDDADKELENLHKYYNYHKSNENHVLNDISLKIDDGEFVAIIGKTGVGKSTLVHILACIDTFQFGEYKLNGLYVKKLSDRKKSLLRNKYIGIVLQEFGLIEGYTVLNNVMTPLLFSTKCSLKKKETMAVNALKKVGIEDLATCSVNKISSGQRQRTAIARAIVNSPRLLIADEPTGALDIETSKEIIQVFKSLNISGITVIIITHDLKIAKLCNRIIKISNGKIVSDTKLKQK